ncbi:MAG: divisome protein SepX/GlpR [Kribbellaceae bacterium]
MGTTGLIYVAIVAAWAAYLVPMWLRRHDEMSRLRSMERYSSAMRVLSRQADGERPKYVVRRGDEPPRVIAPAAKRSAAQLRARRVAAMRRRRVLSVLTLSLASVGALAAFAMLPVWTPAIPGALIVLFVVLARMQVRKQAAQRVQTVGRSRKATRLDVAYAYGPATPAASPAASSTAATAASAASAAEAPDAEPTVEVTASAPAEDPAAEGLWDPVPVTLPTYVFKEKAPRTVRTIALPGTEFATPVPDREPLLDERVPEPAAEASEPAATEPPRPAEPAPTPVEELDEHIQIARAVGD